MKKELFLLLLILPPLTGHGLIAVCPNPEKNYKAEWIVANCSNCSLKVIGKKIWKKDVFSLTIITNNKTAFLKEFPEFKNLKPYIEDGIVLPNRGAKIVLKDGNNISNFTYKNAKKGEIFYKTNYWHICYEDWSNFKPITLNTTYTIIQSPSNYKFECEKAIVFSYTYTYPAINSENVTYYLEKNTVGGTPSQELNLKNVHFLAGSYRFFHYKFAILWRNNVTESIITTENWKWCNRGYYVVFKDKNVSNFLFKVIQHDKMYVDGFPKKTRRYYLINNNKFSKINKKEFKGKITIFILPDCSVHNPIIETINSAKNRLYIEAPYLLYYPELINAIKNASKRVKILILLSKIDNCKYLESIPNVSVKFYPHIHGKLIISDEKAIITSANLDKCGLEMNREMGVIVYGKVSDWLAKKFMDDYNFGIKSFKINKSKFLLFIVFFAIIATLLFATLSYYKILLPRKKM